MKKFIVFFLLAALMLPAFGCRNRNKFVVTLDYQCDVEIYAVHLEYSFGDQDAGGQMLSLTPENDVAFEKGERLTFSFSKKDLPEDANLRAFSFELYLVLADGSEVRAGSLGIAASYGETYRYVLRGNVEEGFLFQRGNG